MLNSDVQINPVIYYSEYGYVEVDKNEMKNEDPLIAFKSKAKFEGKINVNNIF